ncbi:MAG: TIGR02710 family CRISPR-associated protein, partial [Kiritimatiellaeota bacterium]|nr:TIGR02710 family CRISPR-associated protein [Kiritimatiellota bacterium]
AYFEIMEACGLFNRGQYANSAELFTNIAQKVTDKKSLRIISLLNELVNGYAQWDVFNHKEAVRLIGRNLKMLDDVAEIKKFHLPNMTGLPEDVRMNFTFLEKVRNKKLSFELIYDLLANALRRAELEKKYEDATARTYSAIEKTAKLRLLDKYGIDNSACYSDKIPEGSREKYTEKYSKSSGKLAFGALASFELLLELGDVYGERFARRDKIKSHMTERNYSILGHGIHPIDKSKFDALFEDALALLDITVDDLPRFAQFDLRG